MKNPKYIVGLMLAVLVGVWLALKSNQNLGADLQKNRIGQDDSTALNMKANTFHFAHKEAPKPSAPQWGSFKAQPQVVTAAAAGDKNSTLLKDLAKKVADKMKGEKDKKKKKQAAQKKKPSVTYIADKNNRVDKALRRWNEDSQNQNLNGAVAVALSPVSNKNTTEEQPEKKLRSLEEWQQLLTGHANSQAVTELLNAYQNNELGQKEWAFSLAQEMLENPDSEIQLQGLTVLNALPSDQSFAILATHNSQSDSHPAEVNKEIKRSLAIYAHQIQNLNILERAVASNDPIIQKQAAILIQASASIHLANQGRNRRDGSKPITVPPIANYLAAVQVLSAASRQTKDAELKLTLDQTIANIQSMISMVSNVAEI